MMIWNKQSKVNRMLNKKKNRSIQTQMSKMKIYLFVLRNRREFLDSSVNLRAISIAPCVKNGRCMDLDDKDVGEDALDADDDCEECK